MIDTGGADKVETRKYFDTIRIHVLEASDFPGGPCTDQDRFRFP